MGCIPPPLHHILDPPPVGVTFVAITLLPWCRKLILKWKGGGGGRKTQSYTAYAYIMDVANHPVFFYIRVFYDICDPRSCTATHTLIQCTDRDVFHAPHPSQSSASDVMITEVSQNDIPFKPTDNAWRKFNSCKLKLPPPQGRFPSRPDGLLNGDPKQLDIVKGDGNCFLSAISKEICGTERHHQKVRDEVVCILGNKAYSTYFENYSGHKDMSEYLSTSGMNQNAVWATDIEIVAIQRPCSTQLSSSITKTMDVDVG